MELELGLKITHTRDDITSFADLRIAKDPKGPLFLSRETETMFILIVYLEGFRRENIEIRINEEGNLISISGKKPVQEMALIGWFMHKKDVELRSFRKDFRIPSGVVLDRIKAKFKDHKATLTITMPKMVKGIRGVGIEEEVMTEEVGDRGRLEAVQTMIDNKAPDIEKMEEIQQVGQKEIDRMEPELTQVLALEDKETLEEKNVTNLVMEKVADQARPFEAMEEACDVFDERDSSKGIISQEKSEEPKMQQIKEESERVLEKNIDEKHSKKMQEMDEVACERIADMRLPEEPEMKDQRRLEEDTPLKEETPATTVTSPATATMETKQVKPKKEIKQPKVEELTPPEEHDRKQETPAVESVQKENFEEHNHGPERNELAEGVMNQVTQQLEAPSRAELIEANHLGEYGTPQESMKQDSETNVPEPTKPEHPREKEPAETRPGADQTKNHEVQEIKEDHEKPNEIVEATDEVKPTEEKVFDEHESAAESEEHTETKNSVTKRCRLCAPIIMTGSAILVSVIVFAFTWIRSKKKMNFI